MLGKGRPTSPLRSAAASPVRGEKKAKPGALLAGLWPKGRRGQVARRRCVHPLGSAHAGEGAGDGAMAALSVVSPARVTRWRLRYAEERRESGDERESIETNELGFLIGRPQRRFHSCDIAARPLDRRGRPR